MTNADRDRLILDHMPRVTWIASRIHDKVSWSVSLDDLISVGVLGLIAAVDRYDPSYEVKFQTYAEYKIRGAILDSIRGADGIPPHKRTLAKRIDRIAAEFQQRVGRPGLDEEIAAEIGITVEEYRKLLDATRAVRLRSLDAVQQVGDNSVRLSDVLADKDETRPNYDLEKNELRQVLEAGIALLPETQRLVVRQYFLEGKSLREIAETLNVHVTRVSQLKIKGLERLRGYMQTKWAAPRSFHGAQAQREPVAFRAEEPRSLHAVS